MSSSMNRFWIPHLDIHKKVITQELQYHLGPQATVRPYTLEVPIPCLESAELALVDDQSIQGEDGFLISTPGACLTDEQIDDICRKSKELWDRQVAAKIQENPSKTLKRPLHQPITVSRGFSEGSSRGGKPRQHNDRRRAGVQ
ncbi:hypothetical protein TOPH_05688 [Tolypocladium ophioglossoides CBS 100239]|uniref:Uncharacterized protein n=1 Tax=Tolypocladium ophioglossoides (strain CBS 100239) TaxID=1163406 RepID=A0A0L0N7E9_TOLOC|nr:hypothetical protein TOPH_05688 [Tolypocladium ophioglossoides CBS 100239]